MKRIVLAMLVWVLASPVFAFTCQIQVAKGKCWGAHEVTVKVASSTWPDIITTMKLSKTEFVAVKDISCRPHDSLITSATFTPPIWENDVGKVYRQKKQWIIPPALPEGSPKYVVQICFPKNYDSVPMPLGDIRDCDCDFSLPAENENKDAS